VFISSAYMIRRIAISAPTSDFHLSARTSDKPGFVSGLLYDEDKSRRWREAHFGGLEAF